ncbi:MAG TPA: SH3 domain-containing protein [Bryobacteraceae bacterium]|nr:SH3 domain-containing protein [Bryobacteraceae bacterium]
MRFLSIAKAGWAPFCLAVLLAGCRNGPKGALAIGEAYVGPATIQLRSDTTPQSAVVATARRGDRLEILQQKRKVLRVRTAGGAEGWTDERQLLAQSDMAAMKELSERSAKMPAQGQATTYADLRVHTQPSYQAPSFLVLKANEKFDVLAHAVLPRADAARSPLVAPPKKTTRSDRKAPQKNGKLLPPVPPRPPGPPPNWLELSKSTLPPKPAPPPEAHSETPAPTDRWSLIRTPGGESGWVYNRLITMAIPDEVAQYAEGHRIVSYFSLGVVHDGSQKKPTWLWTTLGSGYPPYDFDSFRVFVWSLRRHRYETAHVELRLKGYLPVLVDPVEIPNAGRNKTDAPGGLYPGFSVCTEAPNGARRRREYAMYGEKVRLAGERPCEPPAPPVIVKAAAPLPGADAPAAQPSEETFLQRMKKHWHSLTRRLFGG